MRSTGTDQLQRLADALKDAGDGALQRRVARRLRDVANPLATEILPEGAQRMPRRGGFAEKAADGKLTTSVSLRGRVAKVTLRSKGFDYKSLDAGILRHPVYARSDETRAQWRWVSQRVPLYQFSDAFKRKAPVVRTAVASAIGDTLKEIARKAAL